MTESPESIQEVVWPIGVTSAMPLVITLPGKLPTYYKQHNNECHLTSINAINDEQKLARSQGSPYSVRLLFMRDAGGQNKRLSCCRLESVACNT